MRIRTWLESALPALLYQINATYHVIPRNKASRKILPLSRPRPSADPGGE